VGVERSIISGNAQAQFRYREACNKKQRLIFYKNLTKPTIENLIKLDIQERVSRQRRPREGMALLDITYYTDC